MGSEGFRVRVWDARGVGLKRRREREMKRTTKESDRNVKVKEEEEEVWRVIMAEKVKWSWVRVCRFGGKVPASERLLR